MREGVSESSILVTEYFCGGGLYGCSLDSKLILEGYAMMRSIALDFARAGFKVTVTLDERLRSKVFIPGVKRVFCSKDYSRFLEEVACNANYAIAIAPSARIAEVIRLLEDSGAEVLNPTPCATELLVDKKRVIEEARRAGVKTPETIVVETSRNDFLRAYKEFNGKFIVKPRVGDGAIDTYLIESIQDLDYVLEKVKSRYREMLAQEYVLGENLSLSIAAGAGGATLLSVNKQYIETSRLTRKLSYTGGCTPVLDNLRDNVLFAEKITRIFKGLRGYVGVDFIRSSNTNYLIEVNPRLTTSYVGLRFSLKENPVECIMKTLAGRGFAFISKYDCLVEYRILTSQGDCLSGCLVLRNPISRESLLCIRVSRILF